MELSYCTVYHSSIIVPETAVPYGISVVWILETLASLLLYAVWKCSTDSLGNRAEILLEKCANALLQYGTVFKKVRPVINVVQMTINVVPFSLKIVPFPCLEKCAHLLQMLTQSSALFHLLFSQCS